MIELHFSPGACSFAPHFALERMRATGGGDFTLHLVKLHKGEQHSDAFRKLNPDAQVPVLVVDGEPLTQIVAIADYLDAVAPDAQLMPREAFARARSLALLAWMNNTSHAAFGRFFRSNHVTPDESGQAAVREKGRDDFRSSLNTLQSRLPAGGGWLSGEHAGINDAYAFVLLRWGGYAGINPDDFPALKQHVDRFIAQPAAAAAMASERIAMDTYKPG